MPLFVNAASKKIRFQCRAPDFDELFLRGDLSGAAGKDAVHVRHTAAEKRVMIDKLTKEMKAAAKLLEFEHAAYLRDRIKELEK